MTPPRTPVKGVRPAVSKASAAASAAKAAAAVASSASVAAPLRGELGNALNAAVTYQYAPIGNLSTLQRIGTSVYLSLANCVAQPANHLSSLQRQSEVVFRGQLRAAAALPICCQLIGVTPHELQAAAHDMARRVCLLSKVEEVQKVMAARPQIDLVARVVLCAEMSESEPTTIRQLMQINQDIMIKEVTARAEPEVATLSFIASHIDRLHTELQGLLPLWEERKGEIYASANGKDRAFSETARFTSQLSRIRATMAAIPPRLEEAAAAIGAYRAATGAEPNQVDGRIDNINKVARSIQLLQALLRRETPYTQVNNIRRITQAKNGTITIPDQLGAMPGLAPPNSVITTGGPARLPDVLGAQFVNINTNLSSALTSLDVALANRPHMAAAQSVCATLGRMKDPAASFETIRRFVHPDCVTTGSKCAFVCQNRGEALCLTTTDFARFRVMELCGTMALGEAAFAASGETPEARGAALASTQEALQQLRSCRNPTAVSAEFTQQASNLYPWPQHRINLATGSHLTPAKKIIGISQSLTNRDRLGVVKVDQTNGVMILGGVDFPGVGPCDMKISLHLTNIGQNTDLRPGSGGSFHIELTQLVQGVAISTLVRLLPSVRDGFLFYKRGGILQKHFGPKIAYTPAQISEEMMMMIQMIIASLNANPVPLFAISLTTEDLTERIQRRLLENNAVRALAPLTHMGQLNALNALNDLPPLPQQELPRQRHYSQRNHDYVYESGNAIVIGDHVTIPGGSSVPGEDPRIRSGVVVKLLDQEMVVVEFEGIRVRCFTRDLRGEAKPTPLSGDASVPTPLSRKGGAKPTPLSGDASVPTPLSRKGGAKPTPLSGDASACFTNTSLSRGGRRTRRAQRSHKKKTRRTRRSKGTRRSKRTRRIRRIRR